ncbi:hypothetical protein SLEP1_g32682 [Rubroshorea leprosula]|uniref:Ubiquitin-like protease family profile domain-containing protein n=1 Tax=Rubroshorea leprosula TaxID=152421 RepID=A0AAV5KEB0_9ROSI|nr:hypothetical protein SLEP1_g32682 [Rubroshorea leprosula]
MEGGLQIDLSKLVSGVDEDPRPLEIIKRPRQEQPPPPEPDAMSGDDEHKEDLSKLSDHELKDTLRRLMSRTEQLVSKLPDNGKKLLARIKRLEEEKERRELPRSEVDMDSPKESTKSNSVTAGFLDGFEQEDESSPAVSEHKFGACFSRKMEENQTGCWIINPFDKKPNDCEHQKTRDLREILQGERQKGQSSSRQKNLHPSHKLSRNGCQRNSLRRDQRDRVSSVCSLHSTVDDQPISVADEKKAFEATPSFGSRSKKEQTIVLVDEEEPLLVETTHQEAKLPECSKDARIYYPSRDDPDPVEICFGDIDNLAPEAYLTSTILNFYIRYLRQQASPTNREICDCHFFNTYFYKKLTEAVSDKGSNKIDFVRFRRWWRGVNIFQKAYILIPIHEDLHWSLVIICIPNKEDESGPIMLHLDSLGLHSSRSVFCNIRRFLKEEWNILKQEVAPLDLPIGDEVWNNLPSKISERKISVPQQKNDFDCGLFVLYFMERFIEEAPERLKKRDLAMFGKKWFKPEEASGLRCKIRNVLIELFRTATTE